VASFRIYLKKEFRWNYTLLDREVRIGRGRDNHIVLPHPEVSRHHASIRKVGTAYTATDQTDRGIEVNKRTGSSLSLRDGDVLKIGVYRLVFESKESLETVTDTMSWEPTLHLLPASRPRRERAKYELLVTSGPDKGRRISIAQDLIKVGRSARGDLVLSDKNVSNIHLEIEKDASGIHVRDIGSTNGTRVDGQAIQSLILEIGAEIQIGKTTLQVFHEEETLAHSSPSLGRLIGCSPKMAEVYTLIRKGAEAGVTIMIQGETGCGKELVAKEVHRLSPRKKGPFITVDCSSIPKDLIESELFGHEKGSFTSAFAQRKGAFELAEGGTIFLDEVGELPIDMQPKLLRVLEEKHFKRIGGSQHLRSDFRVIAATNRWLDQEVLAGRFRQDLFFRLYILPISLPPLRERLEDIPLLVEHFLKGKSIHVPPSVLDFLVAHPWPGNVRELRNVMERGVVMMEGNTLREKDLLFLSASEQESTPMPWKATNQTPPPESLEEVEKQVISRTLKACKGDKKAVSQILGIALSTLYEKIRRYGLASK